MIIDCFMFFNEFDVLDIRLHELGSIVDKFVLVESPKTLTGLDKPLYYNENQSRFSAFHDKIVPIIVEHPVDGDGMQWEREEHQRNQIMLGLSNASENDTIIIGDVDEIPRATCIFDNRDASEILILELLHAAGYLNVFWGKWHNGTRMLKRRMVTTPQKIRLGGGKLVQNAGWHFGYLGDANHVIYKLQCISHIEHNCYPYNDVNWMANQLARGQGIFGDRQNYILPYSSLPKYVQNNMYKFDKYMFRCDWELSTEDQITHIT